MGIFNKVKTEYTGEVGSIVRIPCKNNSDNIIFTGTGKSIKIYEALLGKHRKKGAPTIMSYFGFCSATDESESSYTKGYTATYNGNGSYRVDERKHSSGDAIAMEVVVGCTPEVAANKMSNVNKWLRAVAKPTRGLLWWIVGIITSPVIIGLLMLASAIYRLYLSFVRKSCVRKAKASYKKNGKVIVF